jgi:hypothetical protein
LNVSLLSHPEEITVTMVFERRAAAALVGVDDEP